MCGIAGVIGRTDGLELVRQMTERLRHRGPDREGFFVDVPGGIALGHRRLAVLDLTDGARQPMISRDGRWVIVLNGEIFNYRDLRAEHGGRFRSTSDTEVLLECCAAWGIERTLDRAVGMFAFALWDTHKRELLLARDRLGEKPLVYYRAGDTLAFASELKALEPLHESRLDPGAVDAYLALGYVPAPLAIFRGCRKLEPGHLLRARGGEVEIRRWWFPEQAEGDASHADDRIADRAGAGKRGRETQRADRIATLRSKVTQAVETRLSADVPVALALSGGVDSSIVASECVRLGARPDAFTVRFGDDTTDLVHASSVARSLGLRHEVFDVNQETMAHDLDRIWWHYDEPFADSSLLPAFALAKAMAGRYKVVLNGDGGDEAFGGYRHYERIAAKQFMKTAAATVGWCDGKGSGPAGIYVQSKSVFRATERVSLLNGHATPSRAAGVNGLPEAKFESLLAASAYPVPAAVGSLKQALWTDRHLYLPNDLAYKMDTALGAWGMEGRAPFLDHRLLEWTQSLPAADLVHGREKKVLLRAAYARDLPPAVLDRPKRGFGAPIERWMRGPWRDLAQDAMDRTLLAGKLPGNVTGQRLWTLVAFSQWARRWRARW